MSLWDDDLHRRFLDAVEWLGGETNATPKKIWEFMNVSRLTQSQIKSHLQMYRIAKRKRDMEEEMQANANLREELNRWQTQVHLRQYERLEAIINFNKNQQRQEEEMPIKIITVRESSNKADEVSCKSLYQSSRIGPIQIRGDEDDNVADNNNMNLSLELTLGLK